MGLEYIHAALLLHEAKKDITEDSVAKIVESAGIKADKAMAKATAENLKEINIEEVLSSAVAVPMAAAPAAAAAPAGEPGKAKAEKKEDTEKKEEEAAAGLSSLFG